VSRLLITVLCMAIGAVERRFLGETLGDIVVSAAVLAGGFLICSDGVNSAANLAKIALVLCAVVMILDAISLLVTWLIDGSPSASGSSWLIAVPAVWAVLNGYPRVSAWAGLARQGEQH
jgi:hypothetical protein